jgi:membrane fusion protein (multidrug efflux system)
MVGTGIAVPIQTQSKATAVGTILAPRSIQLRTEMVGTIAFIGFKPGEIVEEAQELLKLDSSVEKAQLASAKALQQIADSTYQRTKLASESRAISEMELDQSASVLAQARAEVARLEAIIRRKTIIAPFRAKAGLFDLHEGQYLPEGAPITMLQGVEDYVFVDFMMPQQVADFLHTNDSVSILLSAKESLPACVVAVDSQADKLTRSVMARAKIDSPPTVLQPNDSVKVAIDYGPRVDSVQVPLTALRSAPTSAFVFVVEKDANDETKLLARMRNVVPGPTVGQNVSILSGLQAGERVVTDGSFKLRNEAWIIPAESEGP